MFELILVGVVMFLAGYLVGCSEPRPQEEEPLMREGDHWKMSVWPKWGGGWKWRVNLNGAIERSGTAETGQAARFAAIEELARLRERSRSRVRR